MTHPYLTVAGLAIIAGALAVAGVLIMRILNDKPGAYRRATAREAVTSEPPHPAPSTTHPRRHMPVRVVRPAHHLASTTVDGDSR
jgi:hypothetical protein